MAMLQGDYKRRIQSANRSASVGAGYAVDPVPIQPDSQPHEVCPAASVITIMTVNTTSTSGVNMWFQDSAGTKQDILMGATVARDYKLHFYCPWPVYVSSDVNVTVMVAPPSKGSTTS